MTRYWPKRSCSGQKWLLFRMAAKMHRTGPRSLCGGQAACRLAMARPFRG